MKREINSSKYPHQHSGIRLGDGLIILNIFSIILVIMINFLPPGLLRVILVVPYLVFAPGYALLAAIFIKENEINGIERLVLSVGLSFVVEVGIGLFLNYTTWGIRPEPALYLISGFVFLTSIIAWFRSGKVIKSERFAWAVNRTWLVWGKNGGGRVLTIIMVIGILGALSYLGYLVTTPRPGETFSEFYVLGQPGRIVNYPYNLKVGESGLVYVGITNHESREVRYSVKVLEDGNEIAFLESIFLADGQKWEGEVYFPATSLGENKKIEFMLYRDSEEVVYKNLHLWINTTE